MKKIALIIALFIVPLFYAQAQDDYEGTKQFYTFGWSMGKLIGPSSGFISPLSPAGFTFSGQIYLKKQLAVGFNVTWNNYYEGIDRQSYKIEEGTYITASEFRYMTAVPLKVGAFWNFMPDNIVKPYAGLSIGVNYAQQSIFISDVQIWDSQYGFHVSPEIGTYILFGQNSAWGANISVSYQYNTNSYEFLEKYDNIQGITANIGLSCMIR